MDVNSVLFVVSLIIFLGYIAEKIFEKYSLPDTLILLFLGFIIGPEVLGFTSPQSLGKIAPIFTTFTLLFLIFDGSLSIDLRSFAKGFGTGILLGIINFLLSAFFISSALYIIGIEGILAIFLGFTLGGITSVFVIPILKQLKVSKKLLSVMTIESSITDVFSIVFAITVMQLIKSNNVSLKVVISSVTSLFVIAGITGVVGGILWFTLIEGKLVEEDKNYILMIAYVVIIYLITETLGGNGAISSLFLGLTLANSSPIEKLLIIVKNFIERKKKEDGEKEERKKPIVSKREKLFYNEISFFLKTFTSHG